MGNLYPPIPDTLVDGLVKNIEALRAENARLKDLIDEASKIYVSLTNDSDDKIKQIVTSIKRLKDS